MESSNGRAKLNGAESNAMESTIDLSNVFLMMFASDMLQKRWIIDRGHGSRWELFVPRSLGPTVR